MVAPQASPHPICIGTAHRTTVPPKRDGGGRGPDGKKAGERQGFRQREAVEEASVRDAVSRIAASVRSISPAGV